MNKRILTEASGSLVTKWLIRAIKENRDISIASDIDENSVGKFLADEFVLVPRNNDKRLWEKLEVILVENRIDVVIPSLDETLLLWAEKRKYLEATYGIEIVISNENTIETFTDKYKTYLFFLNNHIPTPKVSLTQDYSLVKPRYGRGSKGVQVTDQSIDMHDMISQEYLSGEEYTVDCLVDDKGIPVYIVPRKRLMVKDGKSVNGLVVYHEEIIKQVQKICKSIPFFGPINIQCFDTSEGVKFTEINPRIGGGMALGLAATENWIGLIVDHLLEGNEIPSRKTVKWGLRMYRYYEEVFV